MIWYEFNQGDRLCVPHKQARYLVCQDDGYLEMAEWNGSEFVHDWPSIPYAPPIPRVPRVKYWSELPEPPTEDDDCRF